MSCEKPVEELFAEHFKARVKSLSGKLLIHKSGRMC
jgi:hypothetical protein